MVLTTITCPGCGLSSTNHHLEAPSGYNATGECYQKYTDMMLQKWMRDVWQCWGHHHNWIRDISKILLK